MTERVLRKSSNKKLAGVCGGVAEYLGVDPTIIRLIWALTILFTGVGVVAYIVAALIMDESTDEVYYEETYQETTSTDGTSGEVKGFKL